MANCSLCIFIALLMCVCKDHIHVCKRNHICVYDMEKLPDVGACGHREDGKFLMLDGCKCEVPS